MSKSDNFEDINDMLNTANIPCFISFGSAKIAHGEPAYSFILFLFF